MDVEKFVKDMDTAEELGRQVDRGLAAADAMLTMIENRMSYGDWLADDKSESGWRIGDEVIPVIPAPWMPAGGVMLAPSAEQWRLWLAGLISVDEFRQKWAQA